MSRPLSVLHIVASDRFAGVEQFIRRLAVAQAGSGDTVRVIGGDPRRMATALDEAGVRHRPYRGWIEAVRGVRALGDRVDVVNAHMTAAEAVAVLGAIGGRGRPGVVATRHFLRPRGSHWPQSVYRGIERRLDAEISVSQAVARAIRVPSTVVHSGVESASAPPAATRARTVLMAQRLQPEKDSHIAVRAFAASGLVDRGWTMQIAGDGPEADRLCAEASALGIDHAVSQLGFISDIGALYRSAGMLIAPCPVEGLGLSVLEAMATGLPIVAADAGGHTEILQGLDPRALFTAGEPDAAGRNLRDLADDDAGRAALGEAGRARQRRLFSISAQVKGTDAVYRRVLAGEIRGIYT